MLPSDIDPLILATAIGGGLHGSFNINSAQSVSATVTDSPAVSVSVIGSPGGTVRSSPAGIDCGSTCSGNFSTGTQVTLKASPAPTWGFSGWGGACSGIDKREHKRVRDLLHPFLGRSGPCRDLRPGFAA